MALCHFTHRFAKFGSIALQNPSVPPVALSARLAVSALEAHLRADLAQVRKSKFATVDQELFDGACAVGVAVTDRRDERVLGAVILSGPTYRLQRKRLVSFVPLLQSVANELTELGNIDIHFGHGARTEADDYADDRKQA